MLKHATVCGGGGAQGAGRQQLHMPVCSTLPESKQEARGWSLRRFGQHLHLSCHVLHCVFAALLLERGFRLVFLSWLLCRLASVLSLGYYAG